MKRWVFLIIFTSLIIVSCQGNTPGTSEGNTETEAVHTIEAPTNTPVETEVIQTATAAEQTTTPSDEDVTNDSPPPGCTVVSPRPTPGPTEQSLFPPASDEDWITGPENAAITIIEYGDFQ